jgi:hypothetical protein
MVYGGAIDGMRTFAAPQPSASDRAFSASPLPKAGPIFSRRGGDGRRGDASKLLAGLEGRPPPGAPLAQRNERASPLLRIGTVAMFWKTMLAIGVALYAAGMVYLFLED